MGPPAQRLGRLRGPMRPAGAAPAPSGAGAAAGLPAEGTMGQQQRKRQAERDAAEVAAPASAPPPVAPSRRPASGDAQSKRRRGVAEAPPTSPGESAMDAAGVVSGQACWCSLWVVLRALLLGGAHSGCLASVHLLHNPGTAEKRCAACLTKCPPDNNNNLPKLLARRACSCSGSCGATAPRRRRRLPLLAPTARPPCCSSLRLPGRRRTGMRGAAGRAAGAGAAAGAAPRARPTQSVASAAAALC